MNCSLPTRPILVTPRRCALAITIATTMAGRGTDIKLANGIAELGGLHVILTELHEAARIDRQLAGRCARQGDPGSFVAIMTLDETISRGKRGGIPGLLLRLLPPDTQLWRRMAKQAMLQVQRELERHHRRQRRELFRQDLLRRRQLAFSRREEERGAAERPRRRGS